MSKYLEQIERIKTKLPIAKEKDPSFIVFGANKHKYAANKPASNNEAEEFEKKYNVKLPECYKTFLTEIGNGGVSYMNSSAGPFLGIFPLGVGTNELIGQPEKYFSNNCVLEPNMSDDFWQNLIAKLEIDEDISDEDYEFERAKVFGGILPIGSQGCTYLHGIILNGAYKGKVVNLDMDFQKPKFTHENNFLDWYERWLDEVLDGTLMQDGPTWFGYGIGGSPENLFFKWKKSDSDGEKQIILNAILGKAYINPSLLKEIEKSYILEPDNYMLLKIIVKSNYDLSLKYLLKLSETNFLKVIEIIRLHALEKGIEWIDSIDRNILLIQTHDQYLHIRKILDASKTNFGKIIIPLLNSDKKNIRSSVINTLGNLKQKHEYIAEYKIGLEDSDLTVVHHTLMALYECKDRTLIPYYQKVMERLANRTEHLETLTFNSLERNLKLFDLTPTGLVEYDVNKKTKKGIFKFWK
ncbi:MAG: hypothetical protein ACJAUJ_001292 [Salibacteraceae bacterium]|jgi:hypothetical protein